MDVAFLLPAIHTHPTGGNVYNRRLFRGLRPDAQVQRYVWTDDERPIPSEAPDVILVDSMLVREAADLRVVRTAHPTALLVMVAHYLQLIDPNATSSRAAREELEQLNQFDGAITTSQFVRSGLVAHGMPPARVLTAPPGLDDDYRASLPERSQDGPPHLLTVASVTPEKGFDTLVHAAERLADCAWRWTVVGSRRLEADYASAVRERLRRSPVGGRVTLRGSLPGKAVRAAYDAADIYVHPSPFETRSMATREAMARGLPVVAFAVGGLPENFSPATEEGLLVSPDASEAFIQAVRRLVMRPEQRRTMGAAARATSQGFPSWAETAEAVKDRLQQWLREVR